MQRIISQAMTHRLGSREGVSLPYSVAECLSVSSLARECPQECQQRFLLPRRELQTELVPYDGVCAS